MKTPRFPLLLTIEGSPRTPRALPMSNEFLASSSATSCLYVPPRALWWCPGVGLCSEAGVRSFGCSGVFGRHCAPRRPMLACYEQEHAELCGKCGKATHILHPPPDLGESSFPSTRQPPACMHLREFFGGFLEGRLLFSGRAEFRLLRLGSCSAALVPLQGPAGQQDASSWWRR